jgi:thiosulfate/3-mercaptopyruvate sulfurtransferase
MTLSWGEALTACILALGLHLTGRTHWRVRSGSWYEWGRTHALPVEVGSA